MKTFAFLLFIGLGAVVLEGATQRFQSGPSKASLIELFTSEGCSSCPPAERQLNALSENPALWKSVVPIAFHVTYWDNLGWPDRFADEQFTQRQYAYASRWGSGNVYTPCFVRDGVESRQGVTPSGSSENAGVLSLTVNAERKALITYKPGAEGDKHFEVWIALSVSDIDSDVARGENAGRKLKHNFTAVQLLHITMEKNTNSPEYTATAQLRPDRDSSPGKFSVAAWITPSSENAAVLQAAGGWLGE